MTVSSRETWRDRDCFVPTPYKSERDESLPVSRPVAPCQPLARAGRMPVNGSGSGDLSQPNRRPFRVQGRAAVIVRWHGRTKPSINARKAPLFEVGEFDWRLRDRGVRSALSQSSA